MIAIELAVVYGESLPSVPSEDFYPMYFVNLSAHSLKKCVQMFLVPLIHAKLSLFPNLF